MIPTHNQLNSDKWVRRTSIPSSEEKKESQASLKMVPSTESLPSEEGFTVYKKRHGGRGGSQRGGRNSSEMRDVARSMSTMTLGRETVLKAAEIPEFAPRTKAADQDATGRPPFDRYVAPRGGRSDSYRGGRGYPSAGGGRFSRFIPPSSKMSAAKATGEDLPIGLCANGRTVHPLHVIENAHQDDIHGFLSISPEHFVSGSKDNTLKMWSTTGSLVQDLIPQIARENIHRGYKYWITSLARVSETCWASGTRDGYINFWDREGREMFAMRYSPSKNATEQYICKDRNKSRINCITPQSCAEEGRFFYTGTPKYIQLWDSQENRLVAYYQASDNDWVYCIEELENQDLLVVIGSELEYWNMRSTRPIKSALIREEEVERRAYQRPHISAITRLEGDRNQLAAALFDGSVKVVDITAQRLLRRYTEHERRVWSVVNLTPELFVSSGDDRTIKIWDTRQERSVNSFIGGHGRVSSLLRISGHVFISGSCPDDVYGGAEKANISFWDLRSL